MQVQEERRGRQVALHAAARAQRGGEVSICVSEGRGGEGLHVGAGQRGVFGSGSDAENKEGEEEGGGLHSGDTLKRLPPWGNAFLQSRAPRSSQSFS